MYTRKFDHGNTVSSYHLPPGYHGNAFNGETKIHEATELIDLNRRKTNSKDSLFPDDIPIPEDNSSTESDAPISKFDDDEDKERLNNNQTAGAVSYLHALQQFAESIRGKVGVEELLLIVVMLIVSSEGLCAELLLLALILIAG